MIDLLKQQRPNDEPPKLLLNQVGVLKRPEIPTKDFAESVGVPPSLVVPFDPQLFGQAANNGQMLLEVQPKSPVGESVRRLAELVTGRATAVEQPKSVLPFLDTFLKGRKQA
jgi:pilus assembly protein CpaE